MMPDEKTTVLILQGVKRVKSIKINSRRIRFAIISGSFFAVLLVISIGLNVYQFMNTSGINEIVRSIQQNTTTENTANAGQPAGLPGAVPQVIDDTGQQDNGLNTATSLERNEHLEETNIFANDRDSDILLIQNLGESLELNGIELNVTFTIRKKGTSQEIISGRFVIVAKTTNPDNPFISYPGVALNPDGSVQNFSAGEPFSMRFLTPKAGTILLLDETASFEYYRIFIYSNNGGLLLQKTRTIESTG